MSDLGRRTTIMRKVLTGEHAGLSRFRTSFRHLPTDPRCKLCLAPFGGAAGTVMRHFGFGRFPGNPAICTNCIRQLQQARRDAAPRSRSASCSPTSAGRPGSGSG